MGTSIRALASSGTYMDREGNLVIIGCARAYPVSESGFEERFVIALLAPPPVGRSGRCDDGLVGFWLTTKISTTGFVVEELKWQRVVHKRPLLHDVHITLSCFCRLSALCTYRIQFAPLPRHPM